MKTLSFFSAGWGWKCSC